MALMIYNGLVLTHAATATDITGDSEIISLSSQSKLNAMKKNTYSKRNFVLGNVFVFAGLNIWRDQQY